MIIQFVFDGYYVIKIISHTIEEYTISLMLFFVVEDVGKWESYQLQIIWRLHINKGNIEDGVCVNTNSRERKKWTNMVVVGFPIYSNCAMDHP